MSAAESRLVKVWNKRKAVEIARTAASSLDGLARLFADDDWRDDGTVAGRLHAVLDATERGSIPGLHTGIPFSDDGFAGDRRLHGSVGFRDPWPTSRNQPGHFLTAVSLYVRPEIVSRFIPLFGSIRRLVGAPTAMSDADVAIRLAIGHEKAPDAPNGKEAATAVLRAAAAEGRRTGRLYRPLGTWLACVVTTAAAESWRQFVASVEAYRTQFSATTEDDLAAWRQALTQVSGRIPTKPVDRRILESAHSPLRRIKVAYGEGNSDQDLRLTLVGWCLGQLISAGAFPDRNALARWLRQSLGR